MAVSRLLAAILLLSSVLVVVGAVPAHASNDAQLVGRFLLAEDHDWEGGPGETCSGTGLYADVRSGTPVRLQSGSGKALGSGRLAEGIQSSSGCAFAFALDRPSASAYTLKIGAPSSGGLIYQESWDATDLEYLGRPLVIGIGRGMVVTPANAPAGASLAVNYTTTTLRGLGYRLDRNKGGRWAPQFWLTSDGGPRYGATPAFAPIDGQIFFNAIGISGIGPDRLVLPSDAPVGKYRLCAYQTAYCTRVNITASSS